MERKLGKVSTECWGTLRVLEDVLLILQLCLGHAHLTLRSEKMKPSLGETCSGQEPLSPGVHRTSVKFLCLQVSV